MRPQSGLKTFKTFSLFVAVATLAACSTTDESAIDAQSSSAPGYEQQGITSEGPLADIYSSGVQGSAEPGTQADLVVNIGDRVFFGYDSYDLTSEARSVLEGQSQWMQQYSNLTLTIEGHADERGTREYNLALGERRASSVKNYLIALGVDPRRIDVISYGKERPAVAGSDAASWAQNRRGVSKVN